MRQRCSKRTLSIDISHHMRQAVDTPQRVRQAVHHQRRSKQTQQCLRLRVCPSHSSPSGARQCLLEMLGVGVARLCVVEREHEQRRIDPLKRPRVLQRARMRRCGCMKCVLRVFCGVPAAKALQTPRAAPPKCCGLVQSSLRGTALRMRQDNMQHVAHARCDTTQRHV